MDEYIFEAHMGSRHSMTLGKCVGELIRCRECLFWPNGPLADNDFLFRDNIKAQCMPMGPNDFCSKAERRKK